MKIISCQAEQLFCLIGCYSFRHRSSTLPPNAKQHPHCRLWMSLLKIIIFQVLHFQGHQ
jgi:hypothetical protein